MSTLLSVEPHISKFNGTHIHVALETLVSLGGRVGKLEERFISQVLNSKP